MVEALTDKYTMRSKAHKRLTKYVLSKVVIEESVRQIEKEQETRDRRRQENVEKKRAAQEAA
jgi:hypothetical protein